MSFWDREVRLWRLPGGPESLHDGLDGQRHQLVGRVLIQVREGIAQGMTGANCENRVKKVSSLPRYPRMARSWSWPLCPALRCFLYDRGKEMRGTF
jgi:hypothetical protein